MGSSTKKAKSSKDRKRRHRSSDDESPQRDKDNKHRHRRHHKERKHDKPRHRDYESDGSDVIISSPQESTPPRPAKSESPTPEGSSESLSIEETNKLRAKLGLKPLDISSDSSKPKEDGKLKDDYGEFYHKPATHLGEKTEREKLKEKLSERKEKRSIENKLAKVKGLGESDDDEDIGDWVEKSRKIQQEKEQAAKRAKILEELDEEFGVGELIESEKRLKRAKIYSDKNLKGLTVEHSEDMIEEGKSVILTLKDKEVLAEDDDVLVNVNLVDDERYMKSNEYKKKKPGYDAYEEEFDEHGRFIEKTLLSKYDEEIDGVRKKSFRIGEDTVEKKKSLLLTVKEKLANKRIESLATSGLTLASDYYTEEEMTKFKKPKKKVKKIRPKGKLWSAPEMESEAVKVDDDSKYHGSRKKKSTGTEEDKKSEASTSGKGEMTEWMEIDDVPDIKPQDEVKLEPDDSTLELALSKARRLKQRENLKILPAVTSLIKEEPQEEIPSTSAAFESGHIVLNATAEFCRTLGDIPTYGRSGNRDEEKDLMDFEKESKPSPATSPISKRIKNAWNPVDPSESIETVSIPPEAPILDEEPDVGSGVGAALKLAMSKGYLEKPESNRPSTSRFAHLQAKHYSIEDKTYTDDDKFGQNRRERHSGPTMEFKEKDCFRPNVKLEYIDDEGRVLNAKEAFRYLSHKFHGKGPGKNKIEKRIKKAEQEGLMKKMSSTDTPLGTLNMLQHKQKEMQTPYIVLSGSKQTHTTSLAKARR